VPFLVADEKRPQSRRQSVGFSSSPLAVGRVLFPSLFLFFFPPLFLFDLIFRPLRRSPPHALGRMVHSRFRAGLRIAPVPRDPDSFESFRATVREALQLPAAWPDAAWRISTLGGQTRLTFENYERVDEVML